MKSLYSIILKQIQHFEFTKISNYQIILPVILTIMVQCTKRTILGVIGCFGAMFIHLVIGSLYQWGIVNIYITSYFKISDPNVTLEGNAIAFPIMMFSIGLMIKPGLMIAEHIHPAIILAVVVVLQSAVIFASSYTPTMLVFVIVYGVLFGLCSGINFMLPIYECNKYFPHKKMYVNGVILTGTGLGPLVFGLFAYNFLNPNKLSPSEGYYIGSQQLIEIALKVPTCLRWLSLLYLIIGQLGAVMISYVCIQNHRLKLEHKEHPHAHAHVYDKQTLKKIQSRQAKLKQKNDKILESQNNIIGSSLAIIKTISLENKSLEKIKGQLQLKKQIVNENLSNKQNNILSQQIDQQNQNQNVNQQEHQSQQDDDIIPHPTTMKEAFCAKVSWIEAVIIFFGACGPLLLNGNYKTYVKKVISNDEFLTIIGVMGSVANGFSRPLWNLLLQHTGYKFIIVLNFILQIIIFSTIRFTVHIEILFLVYIFMSNVCIGGLLGTTPTLLHLIFGVKVGSSAYAVYWQVFATSNFLQYGFISGLSPLITFDGVLYVCLGMSCFALLFILFGNFQAPWKNSLQHLGYCTHCNKEHKEEIQNHY